VALTGPNLFGREGIIAIVAALHENAALKYINLSCELSIMIILRCVCVWVGVVMQMLRCCASIIDGADNNITHGLFVKLASVLDNNVTLSAVDLIGEAQPVSST
jgi:hypothetical protein